MPWLLVAGALLLVGAGCSGSLNEQGSLGGETNVPTTNADAAVKVYLDGSASDQTAASSENADESQLNSTDPELNAYGNAYDTTSF